MLFLPRLVTCVVAIAGLVDCATTTTKKSTTTTIKTTSTSKSSSKTSTTSTIKSSLTTVTTGKSTATTTSKISSSTSLSVSSSKLSSSTSSASQSVSSSTLSSSTSASPSASASAAALGGQTVDQTVLIFARSNTEAYSAYSGLAGYGIPYSLVIVPQGGITLPTLNSSATHGLYGGIIILSEVSYDYSSGYASAITNDQFNALYAYQTAFGVRMVRLDCYPQPMYGTTPAIAGTGCCDTGVEQLISITNSSGFETANLITGATMTTQNIYHYPATINDATGSTWEIAGFQPDSAGQFTSHSTAAVINDFNGRQQMAFFISWATSWSPTSNFLQHAYIHWMTRGLFLGARKTYLSTQIDDVHLTTALYQPSGTKFRLRPDDVSMHVSWMQDINSRLPAGSAYMVELGHNGNGDLINATNQEYSATPDICNPVDAIYYAAQPETDLEFQKPLGTGMNYWPTTPTSYQWNLTCDAVDLLANWFMTPANRDAFMHGNVFLPDTRAVMLTITEVSHTFTHLNLDNSTYSDTYKEITWNQAWLTQVGIAAGAFSPNGLIPPAITGLHNGDAIKAWMDNGITNVVGDNSRPVLMNQQNPWWPLTSTVASNGYAGLNIMPRWSTAIYYNCDQPACTTQEWADTSGGTNDFPTLLNYERSTTSRYLLALRHDPYMFHQANLRAVDVPSTTVGGVSVRSLLQIWTETVTQEMARLTKWPIVTKKHNDLATLFLQRQARDNCNPNLSYQYTADGSAITSVTVTANGNSCSAPIPVTVPGSGTASGSATSDQVGSEPLIIWVTLSGSPVTISLGAPVAV